MSNRPQKDVRQRVDNLLGILIMINVLMIVNMFGDFNDGKSSYFCESDSR